MYKGSAHCGQPHSLCRWPLTLIMIQSSVHHWYRQQYNESLYKLIREWEVCVGYITNASSTFHERTRGSVWWNIETGSHYAVQTSPRIMIFWPQSLECSDFKCVPPHLVVVITCLTVFMGQNCSHQRMFVSDSGQAEGQKLFLGHKVCFF